MNTFKISRLPYLIFVYGSFSVLCQLTFIFLHTLADKDHSSMLLIIRYAPMLEYSFMSLVCVLGGVLLSKIVVADLGNRN